MSRPQLLELVVAGGGDQPPGPRPLPSLRDEPLIDGQLPRNQTDAGAAVLIELGDDLKDCSQQTAPRTFQPASALDRELTHGITGFANIAQFWVAPSATR